MNSKYLGSLYILIGAVTLSIEIYGLKIIQVIEMASGLSFWNNSWHYLCSPPVIIAALISVIIIIAGFIILYIDKLRR